VYCLERSIDLLMNCTITGNETPDNCAFVVVSDEASPTLTNCIVWNNTGHSLARLEDSALTVTYSSIQGQTVPPGPGNTNLDPLFAGPGDLHLLPGSPCIDAGTAEGAPAVDFEGQARPCGAGVDMGADESCGAGPIVVGPGGSRTSRPPSTWRPTAARCSSSRATTGSPADRLQPAAPPR